MRILLVEDNPDDVALTLRTLKNSHVSNDVVVARDGAEALDLLFASGPHAREEPVVPVFVLLDLNLPKVDGLDVLGRMTSDDRTRRIPVIVLTSSKHEEDLIESYSRGASSYVRKPMDFVKLVEAVSNLELAWLVTR